MSNLTGRSAGKSLIVARHEFLKTIRRKEFFFMTFIFPLFFFLIALGPGLIATMAPTEAQTIGYIDLSHSLNFPPDAQNGGQAVAPAITENSGGLVASAATVIKTELTYPESPEEMIKHPTSANPLGPEMPQIEFVRYEGIEEARQALLSGKLSSYLVIPADFLESGFIELYTGDKNEIFSGVKLSEQLSDIIITSLLSGKVDDPVLQRVRHPVKIKMFNFGENGEAEEQGLSDILSDFGLPFVTSILLFFSIFSASGYLLRGIAEEKENRIIEVLLSSVTPMELLFGKILGLGAVGLLQIVVWVSAVALGAVYTFPIGVEPSLLFLALVYFLLGFLIFSSLMAGVGALTSSLQESQQVAGLFTFAAAFPLVFMQLLLTNPDSPIPVFLSLFPLTSPVAMMARLTATEVPFYQIAVSILILIVSIYGVVLFSSRVFRAYLLMYGKRPKLREIWRSMREE